MTPATAAARLSMALRPERAAMSLAVYHQFAREVAAEAGPTVLADIVREVELHAPISRRVA